MINLSTLTGLAAVPGMALRLKIAAAAAVALIAATLYAVHHFTAKGYEAAAAECRQRALQADVHRLELEKQAEEDRRDIAIWNALGRQRIKAGAATQREEVKRDNEEKPAPPVCTLDADSLWLWNAPTGADPSLQVRPGRGQADRGSTRDAAALTSGRPGDAEAQPGGQQGSLRGIADGRAGVGFRSPRVSEVAGRASGAREWQIETRSTSRTD